MHNEQIDRLAAERVMGWHVHTYKSGHRTWAKATGEVVGFDDDFEFSPTTNEAHAALLREKMRQDGWVLRLFVHPTFHEAEWVFDADRIRIGQSGAGTPSVAYAITAAALLAVGAVTEEELNG